MSSDSDEFFDIDEQVVSVEEPADALPREKYVRFLNFPLRFLPSTLLSSY